MFSMSRVSAFLSATVFFAGTASAAVNAAQSFRVAPPIASVVQGYSNPTRNLELVESLYAIAFNQHNLGYVNEIMRPDLIQHNPDVATGRQAFISFFALLFKQYPQFATQITQAGADGDRVWVQSHQRNSPSVLGLDIIDIYRIQDGKIAEHWDSIEPVVNSTLNGNTQF